MGGNLIIYNSDRDSLSLSASAGSSTEEYYLSISNILWETWEQFSMSTEHAGCWVPKPIYLDPMRRIFKDIARA